MLWRPVFGTRTTPSHRTHGPYPYATYSTLDRVPILSTHVPTHVLDTYSCGYLHPAHVPTRTPSARTYVPYPLSKHVPTYRTQVPTVQPKSKAVPQQRLYVPYLYQCIKVTTPYLFVGFDRNLWFHASWKCRNTLMAQKSGVHSPVEGQAFFHYLRGFIHPRWCRISCIMVTWYVSKNMEFWKIFLNAWRRFSPNIFPTMVTNPMKTWQQIRSQTLKVNNF